MVHSLPSGRVLNAVLLLFGLTLTPSGGIAQVGQNDVFSLVIAPAGPDNPRNSEADAIVLKDGRVLLAWTEFYGDTGADAGAARIVGRISEDGGRTWGAKYTLVENDAACNVMEVNFVRLHSGRIALFYVHKNSEPAAGRPGDCRIMLRISGDEGATFGPATQLSPDNVYTVIANGRGLMLSTGRLLLEAAGPQGSYCLISDDDGKTWRNSQPVPEPPEGWAGEGACIELKDGRVLMLLRTQSMGGQWASISEDGGETWSAPKATPLIGTSAPPCITRIPATGDLLAIWNHTSATTYGARRNPLTAAISRDEGATWENFRNIEEGGEDAWAYPSATWVKDQVLLSYYLDHAGRLSLKVKSLPARWFYE